MRKLILGLLALFSCSGAQAFWPEAAASSVEVGVGYRQDNLKWKTKADVARSNSACNCEGSSSYGSSLNEGDQILYRSKLDWKNLNIWQIEATGKYLTCDNVYFRAYGDYGWITSGNNSDKDYAAINASCSSDVPLISHTKSDTSGHVYDANIAIGYQFQLCDDSFTIIPLVGYGWNGQHLKDKKLRFESVCDQIVETQTETPELLRSSYDYYYCSSSNGSSDCSYSYSSCHGPHSTYKARWHGPFIGFDAEYVFGCGCGPDWKIFGTYEFHFARFKGQGSWNLREEYCGDRFYQHANNAYGNVFNIGVRWDLCDCYTIAVQGKFQWWNANKGRDKLKIAEASEGNVETTCYRSQSLRDVQWNSAGISIDLGMTY